MTNLGFCNYQVRFQMAGKRNKFATKQFCLSKCVWSFYCVISENTKGVNIRSMVTYLCVRWQLFGAPLLSKCSQPLGLLFYSLMKISLRELCEPWYFGILRQSSYHTLVFFSTGQTCYSSRHPPPSPTTAITQDCLNHQDPDVLLGMSGLSLRQLNAGAGLSN